jgi:hypothetical protein
MKYLSVIKINSQTICQKPQKLIEKTNTTTVLSAVRVEECNRGYAALAQNANFHVAGDALSGTSLSYLR